MGPIGFLSPPKKLNSRNVFPRYVITMNLAIFNYSIKPHVDWKPEVWLGNACPSSLLDAVV